MLYKHKSHALWISDCSNMFGHLSYIFDAPKPSKGLSNNKRCAFPSMHHHHNAANTPYNP